ncbi:MAG: hypothetical protein P8Q14_03350 [Vicingaceae bacterium]|nr:hypothetical protein [Vicingaceae bacterium]
MKTIALSNIIILITLFFCSCNQKSTKNIVENVNSKEANNSNDLEGNWLVNTNLFDSTITFNRIESLDSSISYGSQFTFNKESLTYKGLNTTPSCGNGVLFIDSCAYEKTNQNFTLFLKGGYAIQSNFTYSAKYLLKKEDNSKFTLIRTKVLRDDKSTPY